MLRFARNKVVGVSRKDRDTLAVHAILDDDLYGLEVDLWVRIGDLELLAVEGKWNRRTTPECPGAIRFLQEIKGLHIDEEISGRINKTVGRKGCRHFANLLIECCYAATEAARVTRWEDAKALHPDLTFESFRRQGLMGEDHVDKGGSSPESGGITPSLASAPPVAPAREAHSQPEARFVRPHMSGDGFVIDLHVHTYPASPCSCGSADDLIVEARRIGLSGICLTDHNHIWAPGQIEELRQRHGFPVFRGNEITTDQGDMLVFGLERDIKGIIKLQDLRQEVVDGGGFLIVAHPFRGFLTFSGDHLGLTCENAAQRPLFQWVDAIEVLNGKVTEKENRFASSVGERLGLPATGGSDAHDVAEVGTYATRFFEEIQTEADLIQALRNKAFVPVAFRSERGAQARGNRLAEVGAR